jgi:hypothetical protein
MIRCVPGEPEFRIGTTTGHNNFNKVGLGIQNAQINIPQIHIRDNNYRQWLIL